MVLMGRYGGKSRRGGKKWGREVKQKVRRKGVEGKGSEEGRRDEEQRLGGG